MMGTAKLSKRLYTIPCIYSFQLGRKKPRDWTTACQPLLQPRDSHTQYHDSVTTCRKLFFFFIMLPLGTMQKVFQTSGSQFPFHHNPGPRPRPRNQPRRSTRSTSLRYSNIIVRSSLSVFSMSKIRNFFLSIFTNFVIPLIHFLIVARQGNHWETIENQLKFIEIYMKSADMIMESLVDWNFSLSNYPSLLCHIHFICPFFFQA